MGVPAAVHGWASRRSFTATPQTYIPHLLPPLPGVLSLNLKVSFCREICLLHGLCDVDRPTLLARLRQGPGSSVLLAVGGASESLLTQVVLSGG